MELFSKKQTHSFADILKGITHAVNSVQEMLYVQQVANRQTFGENCSDEVVSKKRKMGDKELDVPLVSYSFLEMDDREIHFKAKVDEVLKNTMNNDLEEGYGVELVNAYRFIECESQR